MSGYREIEGVVRSVDAAAILFRAGCEAEDIVIPLSALEHPPHEHDNWISVSRNFLRKLERSE